MANVDKSDKSSTESSTKVSFSDGVDVEEAAPVVVMEPKPAPKSSNIKHRLSLHSKAWDIDGDGE